MKQKIIVVSILSVFILMVLPSIPAVEYDAAVKANESSLIDELQGIAVTDFKEGIQKINIHEFREELKNIDVRSAVEELKEQSSSASVYCYSYGTNYTTHGTWCNNRFNIYCS